MIEPEDPDDAWDPTGYYRHKAERSAEYVAKAIPWLALFFFGWMTAAIVKQCIYG